ncbi:D-amino-acid transaminase [Salinicoccus siamensis]|uniref:D-alanine aminotransferase n=1 Tax=Salinicoccus siamensis TaxID=381830 RepID=A0ABV5Z0N8_9STAP
MKISYYNGEFKQDADISIDYNDRAFYFGDGVYEVIRLYNGVFYTLEAHIDRLFRSIEKIGIKGIERNEIMEIIAGLQQQNQISNGYIYLQVSRGIDGRNHSFPVNTPPVVMAYMNTIESSAAQNEEGAAIITSEDYRWLKCDIKSLNLLPNVLEKQRAVEQGAKEAVLHRNGTVTEGTSTNVFIVKEGTLYTHPADNLILNGITRLSVLEIADELEVPVKEESFTLADLAAADEVFITSTTLEVLAVDSVDGQAVGEGLKGPMTMRIQEAFQKKTQKLNMSK